MKFDNYRLYREKVLAVKTVGNTDGRFLDDKWSPTQIIFKGRSEKEAMKKADRFWREGEFGMGRIKVVLEDGHNG